MLFSLHSTKNYQENLEVAAFCTPTVFQWKTVEAIGLHEDKIPGASL